MADPHSDQCMQGHAEEREASLSGENSGLGAAGDARSPRSG